MSERRPWAAAALVVALAVGGAASTTILAAGPLGAQVGGDDVQLPVDPGRDPERTRQRADEILRGDEYQAPGPRDRSLIDRVRDWIGDRLPDLDLGGGGGEGAEVISYVVVGVVVLGAIGALTYVLVGTRGRARASDDDNADAEVDVTPLRTADEWAAEADRCARAGDHRGAVRARFRSLTTTLARRDLVADTPGRTAGELRADVADRAPALTPAFGAVADLFERIWYGRDPAGPEESAAACDLAETALAAAPRRTTRATDDDQADDR